MISASDWPWLGDRLGTDLKACCRDCAGKSSLSETDLGLQSSLDDSSRIGESNVNLTGEGSLHWIDFGLDFICFGTSSSFFRSPLDCTFGTDVDGVFGINVDPSIEYFFDLVTLD